MNPTLSRYCRKLFWATVKGTAHGATAFLTLAGGHTLVPDVPTLNWKGLGCVIVGSAAVSFFKFLDETPSPDGTEFVNKTSTPSTP